MGVAGGVVSSRWLGGGGGGSGGGDCGAWAKRMRVESAAEGLSAGTRKARTVKTATPECRAMLSPAAAIRRWPWVDSLMASRSLGERVGWGAWAGRAAKDWA